MFLLEIGQKSILTSNKILKITFGLSGRIFILMKWWLGAKLIISVFLRSLSKSRKEDRNGELFPVFPSCQAVKNENWDPEPVLSNLSICFKSSDHQDHPEIAVSWMQALALASFWCSQILMFSQNTAFLELCRTGLLSASHEHPWSH